MEKNTSPENLSPQAGFQVVWGPEFILFTWFTKTQTNRKIKLYLNFKSLRHIAEEKANLAWKKIFQIQNFSHDNSIGHMIKY